MPSAHQQQDVYPQHLNSNSYMWPVVNLLHQRNILGEQVGGVYDQHQQHNLTSHILPNNGPTSSSSSSVDRSTGALHHSSVYNKQQSNEASSFGLKNKPPPIGKYNYESAQQHCSPVHWETEHYDNNLIQDRNDAESSLYAEAHT